MFPNFSLYSSSVLSSSFFRFCPFMVIGYFSACVLQMCIGLSFFSSMNSFSFTVAQLSPTIWKYFVVVPLENQRTKVPLN